MMEQIRWGGRSRAIAAAAAAAFMIGLIAVMASGGMPAPGVLDALSVGTAAGALVVVTLAFAGLRAGAWGQVGRALAMTGLTLVLAGDALQAVALRADEGSGLLWAVSFTLRDRIGNGLFFASLVVLGMLQWRMHRWLGGLAAANGVLGYLEMAFAARLGLPPHFNFMLLVVWFGLLAVVWWRAPYAGRRSERWPAEANAAA
jgi:hypothetical protein